MDNNEDSTQRSVLASRAFWIGGFLSLLVWSLIAALVL
jgi:hypothetical protein